MGRSALPAVVRIREVGPRDGLQAEAPVPPKGRAALVDALAQLDPAYRLPVLLHYYADLPLEQVAQSLNLTVPAIKSRLHRARAMLRNTLAESEEAGTQ